MDINFAFVSSSQKSAIAYSELNKEIIEDCQLIVNTSPLGTFPKVMEYPNIPYEYLSSNHILFDLVYNPGHTRFMDKGKENGAVVCNGFKMLEYQALKAWEIWNA